MTKKIVIIIGACMYNRGSEALVRGTLEIIKKSFPDTRISLSSGEKEFNKKINLPHIDEYINRTEGCAHSFKRFVCAILYRFRLDKIAAYMINHKLDKCVRGADLVIFTGADNYDASYNSIAYIHTNNLRLKKLATGKLLVYDCSLEEAHLTDKVRKDIELFDAVSVREQITAECFENAFANKMDFYYYPDPAFMMPPQEVQLPQGFVAGKTIAVNVSSLITNAVYGAGVDIVMQNYINLIKCILFTTDSNVVLLPHVMQGADLSVLKKLYSAFIGSDRVFIVDNESYNAAQLKYIISQCRFFIGARTHATIAAYSSMVPTLVLGYSVKSIGIARDLFGTDKGYVVPVDSLKTETELANAYEHTLLANEVQFRAYLKEKIPSYIDWCSSMQDMFKNLLK